jgi:hypothetical protein
MFGGEDADPRAGDGVEEKTGDGEVEGGEGDLGVAEGSVGEDAFVGEDLRADQIVTGLGCCNGDIAGGEQVGKRVVRWLRWKVC